MLSILGEAAVPVIRRAETRRTTTPNAVMTTLASPTLGSADSALWQVEMLPGQTGPVHTFDRQQVWTALDGGATIELDGDQLTIRPGDTVILPVGAFRRVLADPDTGFTAIVTAAAGARASLPDGTDRGVPAWIA
jgi:quercetin dioxygenase-like cupin family protein